MKIQKGKRICAMLLALVLVMSMFAVSGMWCAGGESFAAAGRSGKLGENAYEVGGNLEVGETYTLGAGATTMSGYDIEVTVLAKKDGKAMVMSHGVCAALRDELGTGEVSEMTKIYFSGMADVISDVNLPRGTCLEDLEVFGSTAYAETVFAILKKTGSEAPKYNPIDGNNYPFSWLGNESIQHVVTSNGEFDTSVRYMIDSGGVFFASKSANHYVVAPAFKIDLSKVYVKNNGVHLFKESTGLVLKQSLKETEEGEETAVEDIVSDVSYEGGHNDGRSAEYNILAEEGRFEDGMWVAPEKINSEQQVELGIEETGSGNHYRKTIGVTVVPREADHIEIKQNEDIKVKAGEEVNLADHISVKGYDSAGSCDGDAQYHLRADEQFGTIEGSVFTAKAVKKTTDAQVAVCAESCGEVDYSTVPEETVTIRIMVPKDGYQDRDAEVDGEGFYSYTDPDTDITWHYRYNKEGLIEYLYTEDDTAGTPLIGNDGVLVVPSSIAGVQVVGIGGGCGDGVAHPFIPAENDQWRRLYIPASVTTINDGAFCESRAPAEITIPSTVHLIGVDAFFSSAIKKVTFDGADDLTLKMNSFANMADLQSVVVRGNGLVIGKRVFENDPALEQINLPKGTRIGGQGEDAPFLSTTGIRSFKTNMARVESNTFPALPHLEKVTFGDEVQYVAYDWAGTSWDGQTVDRQTVVLNRDTVFSMEKTHGFSPFGFAGNLTVIGKNIDASDQEAADFSSEPATAKVGWLGQYYGEDEQCMRCAKGQAETITFKIEGLSDDVGALDQMENTQTGIEAYYRGTALAGREITADHIEVYRSYGEQLKEQYGADEFYVLRKEQFEEKKNRAFAAEEAPSGSGIYVAADQEEVQGFWAQNDLVTATEEDAAAGILEVVIAVPQKDQNGRWRLEPVPDGSGNVAERGKPLVYQGLLAIPVKPYTPEDEMLEDYGSYEEALSHMKSLESDAAELEKTIREKTSLAENLQNRLAELDKALQDRDTELEELYEANSDLLQDIGVKGAAIEDLTENSRKLEQQLQEIRTQKEALQNQYNELENKESDEAKRVLEQSEALAGKEEEVLELNERILALRDEKLALLEERENLQKEQEKTAAELQAKEKELSDAKQKLEESEKKMKENDVVVQSMKDELEKQKVNSRITVEAADNGDAEATAKEAAAKEAAAKEAAQKEAAAKEAAAKEAAQKEALQKEAAAKDTAAKEAAAKETAAKEAAQKAESEKETFQKETVALKKEVDTLKSENQNLKSQIQVITGEKESLSNTNRSMEQKVKSAESRIEDLNEKYTTLKERNERLNNKNEKLLSKTNSLISKNDSLKNDYANLKKTGASGQVRETDSVRAGVGTSTKQSKAGARSNQAQEGENARQAETKKQTPTKEREVKADTRKGGSGTVGSIQDNKYVTAKKESEKETGSAVKNSSAEQEHLSLTEQFRLYTQNRGKDTGDNNKEKENKAKGKQRKDDQEKKLRASEKEKGRNKQAQYDSGQLQDKNSREGYEAEDDYEEEFSMGGSMMEEVNAADFETETNAAEVPGKKRSVIPLLIGGVFMALVIAAGYMTMQGVSMPNISRRLPFKKKTQRKTQSFRKIS